MSATEHYLSLSLPEGWAATKNIEGNIEIVDRNASGEVLGAVTVCERLRNYSLGFVAPRGEMPYAGRQWRRHLYQDAIECLKTSLSLNHDSGD